MQSTRLTAAITMAAITYLMILQELLELEWGGDFVGLGLDEEVPKFLRTNAKVKNRHMSKVSSWPAMHDCHLPIASWYNTVST